MKRLLLCGLLCCVVGCRNLYVIEKPNGVKITAYQSKLTNKSVNIISEVQAIKVSTGMSAESPIPNVSLGWWWIALLEANLESGGRLIFYKRSQSMFSKTITGTTFLYIENDTKTTKKVKVESKPKYFLDLPMIKIGIGDNITKINISDLVEKK